MIYEYLIVKNIPFMKAKKNNNAQEKNENLNRKNIVGYLKNYALNCRYSFNRMLSA